MINSSYDQRPPSTEKGLTLIIKGFYLSQPRLERENRARTKTAELRL